MKLILELRSNGKKKDWDSQDLIREKLQKVGIEIKDSRNGTEWEINQTFDMIKFYFSHFYI